MKITLDSDDFWVWPYCPESPMRESLEWATDMIVSRSGIDAAARYRDRPRQTYTMQTTLAHPERTRALNALIEAAHERWILPIWPERSSVATVALGATTLAVDTATAVYEDLAIVWQSPRLWEVVTVDAVSPGQITLAAGVERAYAGATVMPARVGRILPVPTADQTRNTSALRVVWQGHAPVDSCPTSVIGNAAFYIMMDSSGSMTELIGGVTRYARMVAAVNAFLAELKETIQEFPLSQIDLGMIFWGGNCTGGEIDLGSVTKSVFWRNATPSDIDSAIAFVNQSYVEMWTVFHSATQDVQSFFAPVELSKRRVSLFITDGLPVIPTGCTYPGGASQSATDAGNELLAVDGLRAYAVNIALADTTETAKLDNTPDDGVPVITTSDYSAITNILSIELQRSFEECGAERYRGEDFEPRCHELLSGVSVTDGAEARLDVLDEMTGLVRTFRPERQNRMVRALQLTGRNREDAWAVRQFLHRRSGRLVPFWSPTFLRDVRIVSVDGVYVEVLDDGYQERGHIAVPAGAGWLLRAVVAVERVDEETLELTLDSALGVTDATTASYLVRWRLAADRVEINHIGRDMIQMALPVTESP